MPHYNVEHEGRWAVFSSVVDEFITPFMTVDEFVKWRDEMYDEADTLDCIAGKKYFNTMSLHDCLVTVCGWHGIEQVESIVRVNKLNVDIQKIEDEFNKEW